MNPSNPVEVDTHETRSLLIPEMVKQKFDYILKELSKGDVLIRGVKPDMVTMEALDLTPHPLNGHITVVPCVKQKDNQHVIRYKNEIQEEFFNNLVDEEEKTFDELLIEIKRNDLLDQTGHRSEQLWRLSVGSYISVLLIEGDLYKLCKQRRYPYQKAIDVVSSAILKRATVGLKGAISVVNTTNVPGTVQYIKKWHQYLNNPYQCVRRLVIVKDTVKSDPTNALRTMYGAIPGMGETYVKAFLEQYPKIELLLQADIAELAEIKSEKNIRFGVKKAEKAYNFLH